MNNLASASFPSLENENASIATTLKLHNDSIERK